jgi:hypothetical protein
LGPAAQAYKVLIKKQPQLETLKLLTADKHRKMLKTTAVKTTLVGHCCCLRDSDSLQQQPQNTTL